MIRLAHSQPAAHPARPTLALIRRADGWHPVGQAGAPLRTLADIRRQIGGGVRLLLLRRL